jgi:hypothetical protein
LSEKPCDMESFFTATFLVPRSPCLISIAVQHWRKNLALLNKYMHIITSNVVKEAYQVNNSESTTADLLREISSDGFKKLI